MKSNHKRTDGLNPAGGECRREAGFTLIEVLIALTIFAVGMLAVASMQLSAITVNARANRLTQRTTYAQAKIEELVALPYTNSNLDNGPHGPINTADGFAVSWNIRDNFPIPNVKLIDVTVSGWGQKTVITYAKADLL